MNHDHPGNRRANTGAWARPASHKAPPGGTYAGNELDYRGKQPARCPHCDNTGDVHGFDGERRGVCTCPAGRARA